VVRGGKDGRGLYFLKMDIKSFFRSIDKEVLWRLVVKKVEKQEMLWLAKLIIFHNPASNYIFKGKAHTKLLIPKEKSLLFGSPSNGLPIGNLTSQFFANVYLNELDQFVENSVGAHRYVRYVDDFVLLDEDRSRLKRISKMLAKFVDKRLLLKICDSKTQLQNTKIGIDFLGYYIKPTHTLVRQKVARRFKVKFYEAMDPETGFFEPTAIPTFKSYMGHFSHANSFNLACKYRLL
jgi:RNA-directed DNA polymerase